MGPEAVVLLIERSLGPSNTAPGGKLSDLNMLLMPGGRERSHDEYGTLLAAAGLRLSGVTAAGAVEVIEAAAG